MRKIGIFTTTRAEFGLFKSLLKEINRTPGLEYLLFAGGTHLVPEHGLTIKEIESEFIVNDTFDFFTTDDTRESLAKSMGVETIELSRLFNAYDFDFVCILGDRFELLPIVNVALIFGKPIIHIYGGEVTRGAIDNQIRNMITKASHIHFTSSEEYRQNLIDMGELPGRIFNVGSLSIDNIVTLEKVPKKTLFRELKLDEKRDTILLTVHPVTLEFELNPLQQVESIFRALAGFDFQVVITAPNMDHESKKILDYIHRMVNENPGYHLIESLGIVNYHNLIPHCKFVMGNSSSGIVDVPFFRIPTINIGERQKGRIQHRSIIDTDYCSDSIQKAIKTVLSGPFQKSIQNMTYKFGTGDSAKKIADVLKAIEVDTNLFRKI